MLIYDHKILLYCYGRIFSFIFVFITFSGCIGSNVGSAKKGEALKMNIKEIRDIVNFKTLDDQPTASLASRGNMARGFDLSPVVGSALTVATDAIKTVIANEQKKYSAAYQFALTDLYFYDQLSNTGPFDPVGMQFAGFKISRTFINKDGDMDTAFTARFSLDTTNAYEIFNNSMFRIKLEDFQLKYAKAKVPASNSPKLNMDMEITFHASYVNQDAILFDHVSLGKFYLFIRNAPLDPSDENYASYYHDLKGKMLLGKSFIVPRSFGYHLENGVAKPGYSQGAYTITVGVKESSRNVFESKLITESGNLMIDAYKEKAIKYINKK